MTLVTNERIHKDTWQPWGSQKTHDRKAGWKSDWASILRLQNRLKPYLEKEQLACSVKGAPGISVLPYWFCEKSRRVLLHERNGWPGQPRCSKPSDLRDSGGSSRNDWHETGVMAALPHLQASSGISDTPTQKNQNMLKLRELTCVQAFIIFSFRPASSIFRGNYYRIFLTKEYRIL